MALSRSVADMSLSDGKDGSAQDTNSTLRTNLPLPRELRDKVWGYLLYHEHVHGGRHPGRRANRPGRPSMYPFRSDSRAHTFRFHTNVLTVNHEIHEECSKVLRSNEFVIISHKGLCIEIAKHISSLPIVTENQADLARLKHNILRIHMQGSKKHIVQYEGPLYELKAFCIVATDLPRFCNIARNGLLQTLSSATMVYSSKGIPGKHNRLLEIAGPADDDVYVLTKIRFENENVSVDTAKRLIKDFSRVVQGNQRVSILNSPKGTEEHVQHLKKIMSPKTIWLKAMGWHVLEACQAELAEAAAAAEAGDLDNAVARYWATMHIGKMPTILGLPGDIYKSDAGLPYTLLCLSLLDAAVTEANIPASIVDKSENGLITRDAELFTDMNTFVRFMLDKSVHATNMESHPTTTVYRAMYRNVILGLSSTNLQMALRHFQEYASNLEGDANFDHDVKLIRDLNNSKHLRSTLLSSEGVKPEFIKRTSACQLPVKVYRNPFYESFQKPDGLEGFVDLTHLAELKRKYPGKYNDL